MRVKKSSRPPLSLPSPISHLSPGFTLIEVLLAFAVLVSALTLIAAAFSRHLAALQLLQRSVAAHGVANRQLIQGMFRREAGIPVPAKGTEGDLEWELVLAPFSLEPEPLKEVRIDDAQIHVNWAFRQQQRSLRISTGLSAEKK